MIVLVGIGVEGEDSPQRLDSFFRRRRIVELLKRPADWKLVFGEGNAPL